MGQDEGENFDDETLLGHGVDAPGEEVMEHAPHRLHHPPPHDGQVLHPREIPPAVPPADDHGNNLLGLPEEVLVQMALVPPVQVELRPLGKVQGKEEKRSEVVEAPRGQVHLVDELPVVHQEVELEAVEVDPLAGDEAAVGLVREEAGAGGADVLAALEEAMRLFPPRGTARVSVPGIEKKLGRNEQIAHHIFLRTGKTRSSKQIRSALHRAKKKRQAQSISHTHHPSSAHSPRVPNRRHPPLVVKSETEGDDDTSSISEPRRVESHRKPVRTVRVVRTVKREGKGKR